MNKLIKMLAVCGMVLFLITPLVFADAVDDYKKAADLKPDSVKARYNLGAACYNAERYDEAIDNLRRVLEMNRSSADHAETDYNAAQMLGIIFFNVKGNDDEAIRYFKKAMELKPSEGDNYYFAGLAMARKGMMDEALASLEKSVALGTGNVVDASFQIGQIHYRKNDYAKAAAAMEKVVASDRKNITALEILGDVYTNKNKDSARAVKALVKLVDVSPDNFSAYYWLGLNYYKMKEYDKMIAAYKKAVAIKADFADAYYNLGMAYYYRNMYEEAIEVLEKAKQLNASDAATLTLLAQLRDAAYDSHMSNGTTFLTSGNYLKAKEEFELALKARQGNDGKAADYLNKSKDLMSREIPGYLEKARKAFKANRYADAFNEWDAVLQMDPENGEAKEGMKQVESNLKTLLKAKENMAQKYLAEDDVASAIKEYTDAKKLAKDKTVYTEKIAKLKSKMQTNINSYLTRAEKAFTAGEYKTALGIFNDAAKVNENNPKVLDGLTKVNAKIAELKETYMNKGIANKDKDKEMALRYFKKLIDLDPNNEKANRYITELTGKQSQVAVNAKEVKVLYYQGVDKYVNGDIEEAVKIWRAVLKIDPKHVEAQKNIKRAQEKMAAIKNLTK